MWRKPTVTDLAQTISQAEIDAYRQDAALDGSDPAEKLVATTADLVRGYIRSSGKSKLSPVAGEIPESLISPAMDYAAYQVLKRQPIEVGKDRVEAYKAAVQIFRDVANGTLIPESYAAAEDAPADKVGIAVVRISRARVTPEKLEGL